MSRPGPLQPLEPIQDFLSFPRKIQVQTINRCNYTCPMCPYPDLEAGRAQTVLDERILRRMIEEIRDEGRHVRFCLMLQNEPLLDKRFLGFLDLAHGCGDAITSVATTTNGSVLTEEILDRMMAYDRFYLTVSVNATERERYRKVHNRDLWERIHHLLTGWQGRRERIRLSFVVDADSVGEAREFQRFWRGYGYGTRFLPIFARIDTMEVESPLHALDHDFGFCHLPVDTLAVLADGSVILCCQDWQHEETFGNLRDQTIKEVWNSPAFARVRRAAIRGSLREQAPCTTCDYPIRSSRRLRLEALLTDLPPPATHTASFMTGDGGDPAVPVVVWRILERTGSVVAFVPPSAAAPPADIRFELRIGHHGEFNFGSLDSIWCPARASRLDLGTEVPNAMPLLIELDRSAPEFQFFPWYCADWPDLAASLEVTDPGAAASAGPP